jgi:hypothetical protein
MEGFETADTVVIEDHNIKVLGLGTYGTGKSTFAATFPTPGFVFDFDSRIATYREHKGWSYSSYPLTAPGWIKFDSKDFNKVKRAAEKGEIKTVVFDSVTALNDMAMARAMQMNPQTSPEGGPVWNIHYQIVKNLVEPKLKAVLSLPCNVVILGHWDIRQDPKTGNIIDAVPMITGNLKVKVPGYFDEVYAFYTEPGKGGERFFFRTISFGHYKARSTLSGKAKLLPEKIDNDYQSLMEHYQNALAKEKERKDNE